MIHFLSVWCSEWPKLHFDIRPKVKGRRLKNHIAFDWIHLLSICLICNFNLNFLNPFLMKPCKILNETNLISLFNPQESQNFIFLPIRVESFRIKNVINKIFTKFLSKINQHLLFLSSFKVDIFWEGHKIMQNLHLTFDHSTYSQK